MKDKLTQAFRYASALAREPHSNRHMVAATASTALVGVALATAAPFIGAGPSLSFALFAGMLSKIFRGIPIVNNEVQQTHVPSVSNKGMAMRAFDFVKDSVTDKASTRDGLIFGAIGGALALATGAPIIGGALGLGLGIKAWQATGNVLDQRYGYRRVPQF